VIFANRNKLRVAKLGTKALSPNSCKPIRCDFQRKNFHRPLGWEFR